MRIAIITDQHFGCRKNSKIFHDYFLEFYNEVFFPYLESMGITTIIDMGDTFDSRKGIDFSALAWAKDNYYDRLKDMGITVHTIVGNHTAYYKNTNKVNAVDLLLREYDNVYVYDAASEIELDGLNILLIPWICKENEETTYRFIQNSTCSVAMGHLELNGFKVNKAVTMDHGGDTKIYSKFSKVFTGHYHTRSDNGRIFYVGNPYEMFWTDVNDSRGFTIFETTTQEHFYVDNPYQLFHVLYYDDDDAALFNAAPYEDKIVKVVVRNKPRLKEFEKYIDKLYSANVYELKIVENFQIQESVDFEIEESEDTFSILDRYIEESETELDKTVIQKLVREIYQEACEMV